MLDSDELARIMIEISAGWKWGDPRSEVLQTPEHEAKWKIIARQMKEIADKGGIAEIPAEWPNLTGHREKWPQPPRVADGGIRPESKKPTSKPPSRSPEPEEAKTMSKAGSTQIERTYLAAKGRGGISVLYMMEEGPDSLRDLVLRESGWVRTSTLADWRFGERSDIDEITREEAKRFADNLGLGQFVK
ncbi:MAG: hypothetical protein HOE14_09570 [Gemmatimonadales bacterium]|nr:hypothetical protein [Gemmatimonadales bacterium]